MNVYLMIWRAVASLVLAVRIISGLRRRISGLVMRVGILTRGSVFSRDGVLTKDTSIRNILDIYHSPNA